MPPFIMPPDIEPPLIAPPCIVPVEPVVLVDISGLVMLPVVVVVEVPSVVVVVVLAGCACAAPMMTKVLVASPANFAQSIVFITVSPNIRAFAR
jgi:hypothetical protein